VCEAVPPEHWFRAVEVTTWISFMRREPIVKVRGIPGSAVNIQSLGRTLLGIARSPIGSVLPAPFCKVAIEIAA